RTQPSDPGGEMSRSIKILVAFFLVLSLGMAGCAKSDAESGPADSKTFQSVVEQADQAMQAGDAKGAYDLYAEALSMGTAEDPDRSVATRQELAKHLFIARGLLASDNSEYDPKPCVTIIVEHSSAETETAEAKSRILAFFQEQHDVLVKDIGALRATIEAEKSFKIPMSVSMVGGMKPTWTKDVARLEGDYGTQVRRALDLLVQAADEATACQDHEYIDEAVAELDKSERTLAQLQGQIDKIGAGSK
ncbi:MAG: hypothetical protein U1E22_02965, partial [Coriobacteriia bacterium]|nr:hypothetical protein [Coriobacteriia bacterium]